MRGAEEAADATLLWPQLLQGEARGPGLLLGQDRGQVGGGHGETQMQILVIEGGPPGQVGAEHEIDPAGETGGDGVGFERSAVQYDEVLGAVCPGWYAEVWKIGMPGPAWLGGE